MARYWFGGGIADWAFSVVTVSSTPDLAQVTGGSSITCWSAETGGSQYTDLLDSDGAPVMSIMSSDGTGVRGIGQIPPFRGPDGARVMWVQGGTGPRTLLVGRVDAVDRAGDAMAGPLLLTDGSPAASEAQVAAAVEGIADAVAVGAVYRNQLPVRGVGGRSAVLTIVVYHAIASSAGFNTDLDYYQEWNYTTVTLDQVADFIDGTGSLPDKPLLITFDDGYASQYTNAYPGLRDRGMTATFYVTTGWLDGTVSQTEVGFTESTPLTWAQCHTMFADGMRIQTHTTNHLDQTTRTAAEVTADYLAAKTRVEQMVPGETVGHMAYPYGAWDDAVKQGLETAGCRTARVVRIDTRSGGYPGPNGGRLSYALLGLHHRYELPCAGTNFGDLMQANFYRSVGPDEELIPDYGFEAGGKGWTLSTGFAIDTAVRNSGSRSMRCDEQASTVTATPSRLIPVGMFCRLVGSVWIKTVGLPPAALTKLQYQIVKPDGATIYQTVDAVTITGNNGAWTEYPWSYTGDINTGYLRIYLWLQGSSAAGAGSPSGSAWWDDLTLKRDVLPSPLTLPF